MDNFNQNQANINLRSTSEVKCSECGSQSFRPIYFFRKLSSFLSPDGNEHLIPLDSLECSKCGNINDEFNPVKNLPSIKQNDKSK